MHYDVQEYNKQVVSSEKEMLLFNIGQLRYKQPPHFMMVSSVSQSRTFSAGLSFQWSQIWSSLFPATPSKELSQFPAGSSIWQAGPFTAGAIESPTITFVPIQGQDFANRFESTLADKFAIFNEDLWDSKPREYLAELVSVFAEDLDLYHGDGDKCKGGVYYNRRSEPRDSDLIAPAYSSDPRLHYLKPHYYGDKFSECVEQIVQTHIHDYEQIEGNHKVPTTQGEDPKAADVVTAQQAGYRWTKQHNDYNLASPAKILGWFDYIPEFVDADEPAKTRSPLPVFWTDKNSDTYPGWQYLQYTLPKGYSWKAFPVKLDENGNKIYDVYVPDKECKNPSKDVVYALVPDGYELDRYDEGKCKGSLKFNRSDKPVLRKIEDEPKSEYTKFSYSDDIIDTQWPFPFDEVYVELRQNKLDYRNIPAGTFLGRWNEKTYYLVGSWVSFNGTGYRCIAEAQGERQSPTNTNFWKPLGAATDNLVNLLVDWNPNIHYSVGNWVSVNGTGYVCIADAQGTTQSPMNAHFWRSLGATTDNLVNPPEDWKQNTHYLVGDWVSFNGTSYVCIKEAQGPTQSPTNPDLWRLGTTTANLVEDSTAKKLCAQGPPKESDLSHPGLVCGYFKIGNLLQIMHRLADNSCAENPPGEERTNPPEYRKAIDDYCSPSIFGIGVAVPKWADSYASFTNPDGIKEYAWVPAHDPNSTDLRQRDLAERDRREFLTLYKLYQMSLVDTSKLVTGAPSITISK